MNKYQKNDKDNIYANITSYIHKENTMKYSMYSTHFKAEMKSSK